MTEDEHVADDLPELALGLLDGPPLAHALNHVDVCERCRAELDELIRTTDGLLAAGPRAEPPTGFESEVLARLASGRRRRVATRWLAAAAAAVLLVVGGSVALGDRDGGSGGDSPPTARLASGRTSVGWAWLLPGTPGRVVVEMSYRGRGANSGSASAYGPSVVPVSVELLGDDGSVRERQSVVMVAGVYNGVLRLRGGTDGVRSIRMVGPSGAVLCHGRLS